MYTKQSHARSLMRLEGMPLYVKPYLLTDITREEQQGGVYHAVCVGDCEFG